MKHFCTFLITFLLLYVPATAQRVGNLALSGQFHQPVGSFGGLNQDNAANAGFGPGLCLDIDLPVFPLFNWMTMLSIFANPYSGHEYRGVRPVILMDRYFFKSVEVATGLRLRREMGHGAEFFLFSLVGIRRIAPPGFEGIASDIAWRKELVRYQFTPASRWGATLGIGLLVEEKYTLSIRYAHYGGYDFEGLIELNDTNLWEETIDHLTTDGSTISISLGLNFRYD